MDEDSASLTVYFEDPFWVGVFERKENGKLKVAKVIFGSEPTDLEVFLFVRDHYHELRFSPAVEAVVKREHRNPKKRIRDSQKELSLQGIGTKAQQALKLQQEQSLLERRSNRKQEKRERAKRLFDLKQQKKQDKHRGH